MSAIKVFLIDDSAVVRQTVAHILSQQDEFVLLGSVANPLLAAKAITKQRPDVLLIDIEMPGMDGLTFLRQQMGKDPIPTVICSTLTGKGSRVAIEALAAGAIALVGKPLQGLKTDLNTFRGDLLAALREGARAQPGRKSSLKRELMGGLPLPLFSKRIALGVQNGYAGERLIVIGSSTGGTQALEVILRALPVETLGIAITQHMPANFTRMFAQRLNDLCPMRITEAKDGDRIEAGKVLIAPGGRHMALTQTNGLYHVAVSDGPLVNRHKPSVDVLFNSAAKFAKENALGIILTGMGDDGARGLKAMHRLGAYTIAQSEETCVVFGMPMEAIKLGAVDTTLPLDEIALAIKTFSARPTALAL
jgi:two-component system chemotaxis response regulator CheB